jgi:cytochrome c-type biogenesis protein CcmH
MLWIIISLLTLVCIIGLIYPLVQLGPPPPSDELRALVIYKDELALIETEVASGHLSSSAAEPLRVELTRRLLNTSDSFQIAPKRAPTFLRKNQRSFLIFGLAGFIILGAATLYRALGTPSFSPLVNSAPDVKGMIANLEKHLEQQPNDVEGWSTLGWISLNTKKYDKAIFAYNRALSLKGTDPELHSAYGEALVMAANGKVTPAAKKEFDISLNTNPKDPRARYFKGLFKLQAGDEKAAFSLWRDLLNDSPKDAAWFDDLKTQTTALAKKLGIQDVTPQALPQTDQQEMIIGMVEGLAQRLKDNPNDADGWIKLMKSRTVLNQPALAKSALKDALKAFSNDPTVQAKLKQAAKELDLEKAGAAEKD